MAGSILALDLATRCGYAFGPAGAVPRSGTLVLKRGDEPAAVAFSNLLFWLSDRLGGAHAPALIVKEAPFHLGGFASQGNCEATVRFTYGLHAVVEGVAHRFGVPCRDVPDQTVRKHFIGRGRMGDRKTTKAAVLQRCRVLGLIPKDCSDDDRADAVAIHDWAAATLGRVRPRELVLFGESAK